MSNNVTPEDGASWLTANRDALVDEVRKANGALADQLQAQIDGLAGGDAVSINDMFAMQMLMNKVSQMSEMSTAVISAANSAIASMARNVKS